MSKGARLREERRLVKEKELTVVSGFNGTGEVDVGPDLEWNPDNPPTVHECSYIDVTHAPDCDGNCADVPMDELDVKLINERKAWTRAGMFIVSTPLGVMPQVCIEGMKIDLFELEAKVAALINATQEVMGISDETFNRHYKEAQLARLQLIRSKNEESLKKQRLAASLGIDPNKKIIGPGGNPLT